MSSIGSIGGANAPSTATGFAALSSEDFVRIMISELSHQDPLAPNDSKAILEQIASIRSIESNLTLKKSLETLVSSNDFSSASGLIGKRVRGVDSGGEVIGTVLSVSRSREGLKLNLGGGVSLRPQDVLEVGLPPATTGGV